MESIVRAPVASRRAVMRYIIWALSLSTETAKSFAAGFLADCFRWVRVCVPRPSAAANCYAANCYSQLQPLPKETQQTQTNNKHTPKEPHNPKTKIKTTPGLSNARSYPYFLELFDEMDGPRTLVNAVRCGFRAPP